MELQSRQTETTEEATQSRGAQQEENSGMKRKHVEDEEEKMSPSKKQVVKFICFYISLKQLSEGSSCCEMKSRFDVRGSDSTFKTIY